MGVGINYFIYDYPPCCLAEQERVVHMRGLLAFMLLMSALKLLSYED